MEMFKQKKLFSAMAGVGNVLTVGRAQAMYTNDDGLGPCLVYPYYRVRGGNTTLLPVLSTAPEAKAVMVRFVEGKNSQEVLDFNLFLSPHDVWTEVVLNQTT